MPYELMTPENIQLGLGALFAAGVLVGSLAIFGPKGPKREEGVQPEVVQSSGAPAGSSADLEKKLRSGQLGGPRDQAAADRAHQKHNLGA